MRASKPKGPSRILQPEEFSFFFLDTHSLILLHPQLTTQTLATSKTPPPTWICPQESQSAHQLPTGWPPRHLPSAAPKPAFLIDHSPPMKGTAIVQARSWPAILIPSHLPAPHTPHPSAPPNPTIAAPAMPPEPAPPFPPHSVNITLGPSPLPSTMRTEWFFYVGI